MPSGNKRRPMASARYAGMGVELAGAIIGLTLLGYWIDRHYATEPAGVIIGAAVGIVGGLYNFIRQALRLTAETPPPGHKRDDNSDDESD
jgi:F0F1-type ATP synthase assembly protein I